MYFIVPLNAFSTSFLVGIDSNFFIDTNISPPNPSDSLFDLCLLLRSKSSSTSSIDLIGILFFTTATPIDTPSGIMERGSFSFLSNLSLLSPSLLCRLSRKAFKKTKMNAASIKTKKSSPPTNTTSKGNSSVRLSLTSFFSLTSSCFIITSDKASAMEPSITSSNSLEICLYKVIDGILPFIFPKLSPSPFMKAIL